MVTHKSTSCITIKLLSFKAGQEFKLVCMTLLSASIMQLGLEPRCPVAVVGFLTPECLFSYFGAIIAG